MIFKDRKEAGRKLAKKLSEYKKEKTLVLALPRGGVPIGLELSQKLAAPLDIIVVRKIGSPRNPEFGIGAIAEGNVEILDEATIKLLELSKEEIAKVVESEKEELNRRVELYRSNKPLPDLRGKTVILVDDGLATGVTARAAIEAVKKGKPKKIIFASPVCAYDTAKHLKSLVNEVICVTTPIDLSAVGLWYKNFNQVTDEEVVAMLEQSRKNL